jgi:calcium-dependent protein kinase
VFKDEKAPEIKGN